MYSTCLYCTSDLGQNQVVEPMPVGRRVAFDAGNGRLWVICCACVKWNLVPFDSRLKRSITASESFAERTPGFPPTTSASRGIKKGWR